MKNSNTDFIRIAFVHDRLYHMWGAEAVFLGLIQKRIKMGSKEDKNGVKVGWRIFTLFSDKEFLKVDGQKLEIVTALPRWMFAIFQYFEKHRVWWLSKLFDYRNLMFFYPLLVWMLRRKVEQFGPDEVVVSSFAAVKNILPPQAAVKNIIARGWKWDKNGIKMGWKEIKTTLYLHSPMQYIWDYYEDNVRKISFPIKQLYQLITPVLRRRDKTARVYDRVICNSHYTATNAQRLYGRDHCEVSYPSLDPQYLQSELLPLSSPNYYIFVGRLVRFAKELDLIIRLFNHTGDRLIIMWSGPDEQYLRSIAWSNIEFIGQVSDVQEKIKRVWQSSWLVNITRESFGMVTAEALCLWVPVFGYHEWGSVELVDEQSGLLISDKKLDHVIEQWGLFKQRKWDREEIQKIIGGKLGESRNKIGLI